MPAPQPPTSAARSTRRRDHLRRPALALALLVALGTGSAFALGEGRDALWTVVSACSLAHRTIGVSVPCIDVRRSPDGYEAALLRAPVSGTHLLVVPTARLVGLEAEPMAGSPGSAYLALAWGARDEVAPDGGDAPWDAVGMAVNSAAHRSQDQLHIHVDCVAPAARRQFAGLEPSRAGRWRLVSQAPRVWGRLVSGEDPRAANPLRASRDGLPAGVTANGASSIAVLGVTLSTGRKGFVMLISPAGSLERYLDADCAVLKR